MIRTGRFALLAAVIAFILLISIVTVSAQGSALQIGQATLQLWPEYDDPGVLVIFSGTFTGTSTFPQTISLPLPAGARSIQATYQDASGSLINRQFEVKDGRLVYEVPTADFHVEYYVDRQPSGNQREIRYAFEAAYPIQTLLVSVQQPARSTDFKLEPAAQAQDQKADNLTYYSFGRSNLAAGERVEIVTQYNKADTGLSAPQLAVTGGPAGSAPATQAASNSGNNWLPWLLIGVGIVALGGLAGYYFLSQRQPAPAPRTSGKGGTVTAVRPPVRPPATRPAAGSQAGAVFCTQCGNTLRADDRFCAQCGAPRRKA